MAKELSLENSTEARETCLQQLSVTLYQKVVVPPPQDHGATATFDFTRLPRPRSRQIKRLGVDYILPMVAQSLTVVGTAETAAEVLDMFDSKEVQHLFSKLLQSEEGLEEDVRVYYKQSVFDYLAANSKRTYDNKICDTLLNLDLMQNADMIGSKMASMVFRAVIAIAQNAPLKRAQTKVVKQMIEKELERAYRKLSVLFWLSTVSFSEMLRSFIEHHLQMTKERVLMLLASICPYDPVDEYADIVLTVDDDNEVATAMELIETAAPPDIWSKVFPLIAPEGDLTLADRVRVGKRLYYGMVESVDDALQDYMTSGSEIWPAFVLDLCIKNELYDFLDSIPWQDVHESVTALYEERRQGRLTDGSHLLLEIISRDKNTTRKKLKQIKEDIIKDHRREEMRKDMQTMGDGKKSSSKKKKKKKKSGLASALSSFDGSEPEEVEREGLISVDMLNSTDIAADMMLASADEAEAAQAAQAAHDSVKLGRLGKMSSMMGSRGEDPNVMSLEQLASQDGYGDTGTYMSQDMTGAEEKKQKVAVAQEEEPTGFLCFKRQPAVDEKANEKNLAAKELAAKLAEGLEKKRAMEYEVRFHKSFGSVGAKELMELKPEPERLELTLEAHKSEEDLSVPVVIEVDPDIMATYIDDGTNFDDEVAGRKKKGWKSLFRRGKGTQDNFLVVDEEEEAAEAKRNKKQKKGEVATEKIGPADAREAELIAMFHLGYRELFFKCDVKYTRELDDEEIAQLPRVLGIKLSDIEIEQIRKEMDAHKQGFINWDNWIEWWRGNSPGFQLLGTKKAEMDAEKEAMAAERRVLAETNARLKAETIFDYWVTDTSSKMMKLVDRRIEVSGKGRGTVVEGSKKGLLIDFDGHEENWEGCFSKIEEAKGPFQEMIRATDLKTLGWRVLNESTVEKFVSSTLEKYDEEVRYRQAKEGDKASAALAQARQEWKKAYDKDAKKSGFGAIAQYSVAKISGKEIEALVDEKDPNDVRLECLEVFNRLDVDQSGTIDRREMDGIDEWWASLNLVDELGVAIPVEAYVQAKNDMFGDLWTLDFDDFADCYHEIEATEGGAAGVTKAKPLEGFALSVREAIIAARPEDDVIDSGSDEEEEDASPKSNKKSKSKKAKKKLKTRKPDCRDEHFQNLFQQLAPEPGVC
jgi:hypothetical protein